MNDREESNELFLLDEEAALGDYIDGLLGSAQRRAPTAAEPDSFPASAAAAGPPAWAGETFEAIVVATPQVDVAFPARDLAGPFLRPPNLAEDPALTPAAATMDYGGRRLVVLDPTDIVATMGVSAAQAETASGACRHVVVVRGEVALLCQGVTFAGAISSSMVYWRDNAADRPWLVGVSLTQGCVVLDPAALAARFGKGAS